MGSPFYDKASIDLMFDKHREILEEIAKNMAKGVASTIYPETSKEDINLLEEGIMYSLGKSGLYNFDPSFIIIDGEEPNFLPKSFDVIVTKTSGIWKTVSAIEYSYDDTDIQDKIKKLTEELTKKVDSEDGKGLSTNDFDDIAKNKVDAIKNKGEGKMFLADDGTYKKGGNGSGFYNVTKKSPLVSGFHTLETAILVVAEDNDLDNEDIIGMIITFEAQDKVWKDFVFLGNTKEGLKSPLNWEEKSVRNVIKSIDLYKGVDKSTLTPDENGNVVIQIDVVQVDDTLNPGSSNAVAGGAVYAKFAELDLKFGTSLLLNTIEDGVYSLSLLNSENEVLSTTETFSGGGGGGSTVNSKVVLTKITENPTIKLGDEVKLQYTYDQVDTTTGTSTGNSATATITVSRGATSNTYTKVIAAGATDTIDVTEYLAVGTSSVRVRVQTNDDLQQVSSISWQIAVVQLKLESSFNIATNTVRGQSITIPYTLTGSGSKTLKLYVNGSPQDDKVITASSSTGTFSFNTANLAHGTHSFQIIATLELDGVKTISSNSIYFGAIITEVSKTTPVIATRFDFEDGQVINPGITPYIKTKRFSNYNITYAVYDPTSNTSNVTVKVDNAIVSQTTTQFVRNVLTTRALNLGTLESSITAKTTVYPFNVIVDNLDVDIVEPTDGLKLKLSANGRSNADINKTEWKYENIDSTLENFTWVGNGWLEGALRHTDKAKTTINLYPLQQGVINNNSFMFSTKFKISNLVDESFQFIKCLDASGTGFVITGQEARMVSKGGSKVVTKFATDEEYNVGFVSFPISGPDATAYEKENSGMLYLYVNGISSGAVQRGNSDNIYQSPASKITIQAGSKATVDIYSMRFYDRYLTDSEMLDAFLIDLVDTESLLTKFLENNILDETGNISVNSLPSYLPYMIITGAEENGVATVLQAAVNNNKNTKYNVDEILYINPLKPTLNFKATGGMIRLQGTSSLAYPIKNYRIYFYDANKNKAELRLGVDNTGSGGTIKEDSKYSFRTATSTQKEAIPVNCFCLKADYAESSSSHNTGTARIVHDVMNSAGDLTPPQKLVSADYPYDVRTTIDGFPMVLFYRKTKNDTPVFLSKFNFNNDKSTEEVFGFRDIPGYHNQPWVQSKFGGNNPTECWEFLNNDYPMGMFLDDDFDTKGSDGKPNWMKVFEARYIYDESLNAQFEAGTLKPYHLERLVKWIKSTQNNPAKFKAEVGDYFDIPNLCDYYNFTDFLAAVDQRVKNMMFAFYYDPARDKVLCYPIFYDNDTILGVRNDGKLKYSWDIDENTTDPELSTAQRPVYAFAGHDSVLWKNLRGQMQTELQASYQRLRSRMSNDFLFRIYDTEQSKKFVERIYNIDALNKYVIPATQGIEVVKDGVTSLQTYDYLESLQGSRLSHRHWWLINRLGLFDARHNTGNYRATDITFKGNSPSGASVKVTAAKDYYFAFVRESTVLSHQFIKAGADFSYTYNNEANIGTIFHIYGGDWAKKLDLSNWGGFTSLSIPKLKVLEELKLGSATKTYTLPTLTIGDSLPLVKKIDITNYTGLTTLDLGGCQVLQELLASGCISLTNLRIYEGAPLVKLVLPINYSNLTLKGLPELTNEGITFDNIDNLTYLWVENSPKLDPIKLLELMTQKGNVKKRYVRFNVNIIDNGTQIRKWMQMNLGGINTNGSTIENSASITGVYQLSRYIEEAEFAQMKAKFPLLDLRNPPYTKIVDDAYVSSPASISNLENETGYQFANAYKASGHILKIQSKRKKMMVKKISKTSLAYYPLNDIDSSKYDDNKDPKLASSAILTGAEGNVMMFEPKYWYKGINDLLNEKNYTCFSAETTAPVTPTIVKSILPKDYTTNNIVNRTSKAIIPAADFTTSLVDSVGYDVYEVPITSLNKMIRYPAVLGDANIGAIFTNGSGSSLGSMIVPSDNKSFYPTSYVVKEIPSGATKLYFSISKSYDLTTLPIVISNSLLIEDLEPEWVEHEEAIVGVYVSNNAMISNTGRGYPSEDNVFKCRLWYESVAASVSPYSVIDFWEANNIAILYLASIGDRDCASGGNRINLLGINDHQFQMPTGVAGQYGMSSTYSKTKIDNKLDIKDDNGLVTAIDVRVPLQLGYEQFFDHQRKLYLNTYTKNSSKYTNYKEVSFYKSVDSYSVFKVGSGYSRSIIHGKYCSILPNDFSGSSTTYYPDSSNTTASNTYLNLGGLEGPINGNNNATLYNNVSGIFSVNCIDGSHVAIRVMVRKPNLTKALSVNEYKLIQALP